MQISLDCIPCFLRQSLEAARFASDDATVHEQILREVLRWTSDMDFTFSPPVFGQKIHRRLREITGVADPYRHIKDRHNRLIMGLFSDLRIKIESAPDSLMTAARMAMAGNVIDLGAKGNLSEIDIFRSLEKALSEAFFGDGSAFRKAVEHARQILYLADNAGEIAFDRLLIEKLGPERVTLAVRGAPVINDATLIDAHAVGLTDLVEVIENGSDAPGTIFSDCSNEFQERFRQADLIIAKGQGNFESLSDEPGNLFFLFKAKCAVIATHAKVPIEGYVLSHS